MKRYIGISRLGSGSYGSVWKAIDTTTKEVVAIKKLKKKYHSFDECTKLQEVKALQTLNNHPNIIKLNNLVFEDNECFFVFEHMNNNLRHLLKYKDKPFSEAEVRKWMFQILQALEYMHKCGYIHRDLKPENLLVTKDVIKVADLGMAENIKSGPPYTTNVTTTWYRAPEVFLRDSNYGSPIDMWAVGLIMAEFFILCPLFCGTTFLDHMHQLCMVLGTPTLETWPDGIKLASYNGFKFPQVSPYPVSFFVPHASPEALDLIFSMCNWNPSKRLTASQALQHPFFQNHTKFMPLSISRQSNQANRKSTFAKQVVTNDAIDEDSIIFYECFEQLHDEY